MRPSPSACPYPKGSHEP